MFILCHRQNVPCRDHLLQNTPLCQSLGLCGEGTWLQLAHKLLEFSGKVITITMLWKEIKMIHKRKKNENCSNLYLQFLDNVLRMKFSRWNSYFILSHQMYIYTSVCVYLLGETHDNIVKIYLTTVQHFFFICMEREQAIIEQKNKPWKRQLVEYRMAIIFVPLWLG